MISFCGEQSSKNDKEILWKGVTLKNNEKDCNENILYNENFLLQRLDKNPNFTIRNFTITKQRFSFECKTKIKAIILASHNKLKRNNKPMKARSTQRENARDQTVIAFGLASDWLSWWRTFIETNHNT